MLRRLLRSNSGCYTCRLRRKKCSEERPVCLECSTLEITCYYLEEKPEWMDGGPRQKEMADRIKAQVKKQASQRRDRKYLEVLESGSKMTLGDDDELSVGGHSGRVQTFVLPTNGNDVDTHTSPESYISNYSGNTGNKGTSAESHSSVNSPPEVPWHEQLLARKEDGRTAPDLHLQIVYLDFIFPYLFPHYKPPLLQGGRGWIFDAIQSNRSIYFTSISLASYYFGLCLANGEEIHQSCTDVLNNRLETQLERGLQELQKEVCRLNDLKSAFDPQSGVLVLQSILQLLVFEIATSKSDNWKLHLNAAIALFRQILPDPDKWTETLHSFYTPRWPPPSMGMRRPWSTNQAALRFFSAHLLFMDVVSSITLGNPPRLYAYQASIFPSCSVTDPNANLTQPAGPLYMQEFLGLRNWVVQALGDVASLDAWKKAQKRAGSLSMNDLVSRGSVLSDVLKTGMANSEAHYVHVDGSYSENPSQSPFGLPVGETEERHLAERIWLLAIFSYLNVVISGWQPSSSDIRWSVAKTTEILYNLPPNFPLQSLTWPICISGCLSPAEDEYKYREMIQRLGPLKVFGTSNLAMEVMERVWVNRELIDETWDVTKCLNILGHGVLLI